MLAEEIIKEVNLIPITKLDKLYKAQKRGQARIESGLNLNNKNVLTLPCSRPSGGRRAVLYFSQWLR